MNNITKTLVAAVALVAGTSLAHASGADEYTTLAKKNGFRCLTDRDDNIWCARRDKRFKYGFALSVLAKEGVVDLLRFCRFNRYDFYDFPGGWVKGLQEIVPAERLYFEEFGNRKACGYRMNMRTTSFADADKIFKYCRGVYRPIAKTVPWKLQRRTPVAFIFNTDYSNSGFELVLKCNRDEFSKRTELFIYADEPLKDLPNWKYVVRGFTAYTGLTQKQLRRAYKTCMPKRFTDRQDFLDGKPNDSANYLIKNIFMRCATDSLSAQRDPSKYMVDEYKTALKEFPMGGTKKSTK